MEVITVWANGKADRQKRIRNAHTYVVEKNGMLYGAVKILKINYKTVLKIVAMECPTVQGNPGNRRAKFADINDMTKDLVRRIVYLQDPLRPALIRPFLKIGLRPIRAGLKRAPLEDC